MNFNDLIKIDKQLAKPIYLQVSDCIIGLIRRGILPAGYKLPGVKKLAQTIGVYTKTIEQAYEELDAQGWTEIKPHSGNYVARNLPIVSNVSRKIDGDLKNTASFNFDKIDLVINDPTSKDVAVYYDIILNDGHPDINYMPAKEVEKNYRSLLHRKQPGKVLNKENAWGNYELRRSLSQFLNKTRGLNCSATNILVSKGNQFSIFLILSLTLKENDCIAFADINYVGVYNVCKYLKLSVSYIKLDDEGIDTSALEKLCIQRRIKVVYVTPHIHYPTTAKLSAARRNHLLQLAAQYNFFIIEDDYDFDFNYENQHVLPMASTDIDNRVVYIGGLNRLVGASLRVSYIVGSTDFLSELARLKVSVDKFSDTVLEEALALTLKSDCISRYRNKGNKYYKTRRDLLVNLIQHHLSRFCTLKIPQGGMAVWLEFIEEVPIDNLVDGCKKKGLLLPDRDSLYTYPKGSNGIRIGYGSNTEEELRQAVVIIKDVAEKVKKK